MVECALSRPSQGPSTFAGQGGEAGWSSADDMKNVRVVAVRGDSNEIRRKRKERKTCAEAFSGSLYSQR